jgi:hypothetical protein
MVGSPCPILTNLVLLLKQFWFLSVIQHTVKSLHSLQFILIIIATKTNKQLSLLRWPARSMWGKYPTFLRLSLSLSSEVDVMSAVSACCIYTTEHVLSCPSTYSWGNSGQSQTVSGVLSQHGPLGKVGGVRQSVITMYVACHSSFLKCFDGSPLFHHVRGLNLNGLQQWFPYCVVKSPQEPSLTNFNFTKFSVCNIVIKRKRKVL